MSAPMEGHQAKFILRTAQVNSRAWLCRLKPRPRIAMQRHPFAKARMYGTPPYLADRPFILANHTDMGFGVSCGRLASANARKSD